MLFLHPECSHALHWPGYFSTLCHPTQFSGSLEVVHDYVGAQGRLPQNGPQWHIDYFELKLLKKWLMQEGHSDPPFCLPENRKYVSCVKGAPPRWIWR